MVPAIHVFLCCQGVDARDKRGMTAECVEAVLNPLKFQPPSPTSEHRNSN
jgi:hypothetical protein